MPAEIKLSHAKNSPVKTIPSQLPPLKYDPAPAYFTLEMLDRRGRRHFSKGGNSNLLGALAILAAKGSTSPFKLQGNYH